MAYFYKCQDDNKILIHMKKENFNDIFEPMVVIDENSADSFDYSKMSKEDYQAMTEFCKRNGYKI